LDSIRAAYDGIVASRRAAEDELGRWRERSGALSHQLAAAEAEVHALRAEVERLRHDGRTPMPPESRLVDVTRPPYSARGDGSADDTAAIQDAIGRNVNNTNNPRTLYLPGGPYLVERTLRWTLSDPNASNGGHRPYLVLQGDGSTAIRLKDDSAGFADRTRPQAVVYTAGSDSEGVFDDAIGGGNEAFQNSLYQLAVDTGNNPGAIGIDYLANNKGTLRDVSVTTAGVCGVSLRRAWPGPCYLKNVAVRGGVIGIDVLHRQYGVTMEDVTLEGQSGASLRNRDNVLCVRRLKSDGPVVNEGAGVMWLLDSPGVTVQGPAPVIRGGALNLPVRDAPEYADRDPDARQIVHPSGGGDDTAAIQAALDSGKPSVWLASGRYRVSGTLRVRPHVRRVFGMDSSIDLPDSLDAALFRVEGGCGDPLIVERLNTLGGKKGPNAIWFEHACRRDLVLRDLYLGLGVNYRNLPGSGDLFVENVHGSGRWEVGHGIGMWARQFNPETLHAADQVRTKLVNDGATVWVMGMKVEGAGTVIHTKNGGRTELLGGFMFWNKEFPPDTPAFLCEDAAVSLGFVEGNKPGVSRPAVVVRDLRGGSAKELRRADVATRLVVYSNVI
jgi:hypothetical protein